MSELLFGTAGVPHSSSLPTTQGGIERIVELGLDCMEVEFVQGVRMSGESASRIGTMARDRGVILSAHAPYYINFNSHDPLKLAASKTRLLQAARITFLLGGTSVVFHPGFYQGDSPKKTYAMIKREVGEVLEQLKDEGNEVKLRPEVTGKPSQFGSLQELLELCVDLPGLAPCLDFAHWHARTGAFNSHGEFISVLLEVEKALGREAIDDIHIHVAGIQYGERGERRHLVLDESDFRYQELLQALRDCEVKGLVICESPNLEEDALLLQRQYQALELSL